MRCARDRVWNDYHDPNDRTTLSTARLEIIDRMSRHFHFVRSASKFYGTAAYAFR